MSARTSEQGTGARSGTANSIEQAYRRTVDEVLDSLDADRSGLSVDEARERHERYGPNRLREQTTVSAWQVLVNQFTDPLIYVLIGALAITLAIQRYSDAIVVGAVLVINGTIGFIQEYRAQTAVQSLVEMVSPHARVRRDGEEEEIAAEELVPGDVILIGQGEVVPADARLVDASSLRVDESALTGESVPVSKSTEAIEDENLPPADQHNMAFMGTAVTAGEGIGVVTAIGAASEVGQISEQVEEASTTETPLQHRIDRLARWITTGILVVAAVTFVIGLVLGRSMEEMLLLAVAMSVSAIPAGLPIVVTVALAIGVSRMARRNALIRNLPAVDTLGSCTTIVSDKTGTLTENRMTVRALYCGGRRFDLDDLDNQGDRDDTLDADHPAVHQLLLVALLCNEAELSDVSDENDEDGLDGKGDPMEVALLAAGRDLGLDRSELAERYPQRDKVPFRTEQRFMATVNDVPDDEGNGPLVLVKGAPERVVDMCDRIRDADGHEREIDRAAMIDVSESLAEDGLRVLAMAIGRGEQTAEAIHRDDPSDLVFVGMTGLLDPPRPSAIEAVDRCHEAGIRVIMVTGDHATTAATIGRQVHLGRDRARSAQRRDDTDSSDDQGDASERLPVRTGQELADIGDDELDQILAEVDVYSRVAPDQKLHIVERLKATGDVVAVTGDGVNDAPALQAAHIGAAMGSGTDVAKETSDMVVTDDDFASIHAAVEEGRTAFRNIRMATFFLLSTAAAVVLTILTTLALDWPLPLLPAQILWLNVVTNGVADVALAFEPGEKALFRRRPRRTDEGILDRHLVERLVIVGIWLAVGTLAVYYWQRSIADESLMMVRTTTLTTLVLFQKVHVFNCRSEDVSIFHQSLLANKLLFLGVLTSLAIHVAAMYIPVTQTLLSIEPLPLTTWAVAGGVALTAIIVNEGHKRLRPRSIAGGPNTGSAD